MGETKRKIARETKIGLAVITLLLILFAVVLVRRVKRSVPPTAKPAVATNEHDKHGTQTDSNHAGHSAVQVSGVAGSQAPVSSGYDQSAGNSSENWTKSYYQQRGGQPPSRSSADRYAMLPDASSPVDGDTATSGTHHAHSAQQSHGTRHTRSAQQFDDGSTSLEPTVQAPAELHIDKSRKLQQRSPYDAESSRAALSQDGQLPPTFEQDTPAQENSLALRGSEFAAVQHARLPSAHARQRDNPSSAPSYGREAYDTGQSEYRDAHRARHASPAQSPVAEQAIEPLSRRSWDKAPYANQAAQTRRASSGYAADSGGDTYLVQPNDSFWTIADKRYGSGAFFKALMRYNEQRHPLPERLAVGDKVMTPSKAELMEAYPALCPKPRKAAGAYTTASAAPSDGGRVYDVKEGDTLFDIARYELGDPSRWVDIFRLNQHQLTEDFDYVKPGMKLILPSEGKHRVDLITRQPDDRVQR